MKRRESSLGSGGCVRVRVRVRVRVCVCGLLGPCERVPCRPALDFALHIALRLQAVATPCRALLPMGVSVFATHKRHGFYEIESELHHTFRPPVPRPPVFISDAWALAILILFGVAVVSWLVLARPNFRRMPTGPRGSIFMSCFYLCLSGVLCLVLAFWFSMPFLVLLRWLSLLLPLLFWLANRAFSTLSDK